MNRTKSASVKERNEAVLKRIESIKSEHPLWGYRRVWAYMKYRDKLLVNAKRVYRLMKENNLLVTDVKKLKAVRNNYPSKPRASSVNQYWGIDMTKIMTTAAGWIYVVIVLDWYSKKIVGHSLKMRSKASDWLESLDMALLSQFPDGSRSHGLNLISDNGSQPTSERFMKECGLQGSIRYLPAIIIRKETPIPNV